MSNQKHRKQDTTVVDHAPGAHLDNGEEIRVGIMRGPANVRSMLGPKIRMHNQGDDVGGDGSAASCCALQYAHLAHQR